MTAIYRRDLIDVDHETVKRRRALDHAVGELQRAANALQAARAGNDSLRDALLGDAHRRLCSTQRELEALE
jgi:predicted metal-dependent hydrolase